jgi:hypothetical protein
VRSAPTAPTDQRLAVSKKTKKRKLKARRNKANHGKKPNAGRRS